MKSLIFSVYLNWSRMTHCATKKDIAPENPEAARDSALISSVLYEMELYPGEYLVLGQKNDMEENADIREDNGEIKQEGMNMTL